MSNTTNKYAPEMRDQAVRTAFAYPDQFSPEMDLPVHKGAPQTYLIASTPRCGSHFLGHALKQMGAFGVPLEYLNRGNMAGWKARFGDKRLQALLKDIIRHRTSPSGRFGLKAHWSQLQPFLGTRKIAPLGSFTHIIHIYRADLLGQAISFDKARQTGQWISGAPAHGEAVYGYDKIVSAAEDLRAQNIAWGWYFNEQVSCPVLELEYEDLISSPEAKLTEVRDFLAQECNVRPAPSKRTQKQSDGLSKEWRAQFLDEMRPEHAWMTEPFVPQRDRSGRRPLPFHSMRGFERLRDWLGRVGDK